MSLGFSTAETPFDDKRLKGAVAELGNAIIAIFWEGDEPRLGTLTVTLPNRVSSLLLGDRNLILGQLVGEQLAAVCGKMALVSTNLPLSAEGAAKPLLDLAKKLASAREKSRK
jgi:hypothetical protein